MSEFGLQGVVRGGRFKVVTVLSETGERQLDVVDCDFRASHLDELWVSQLTFVATW